MTTKEPTRLRKKGVTDDEQPTTSRRAFLGGLAATTVLSSTTGTARTPNTDEPERRISDEPIGVTSGGFYLDAFEMSGQIIVDQYPADPVDCATLTVNLDAGEASATLTPSQARRVAASLLEAADASEGS